MPSATDFLPWYMRLFMNLARITSPNLASGMISRFSALRRRAMIGFLFFFPVWTPALGSASAGVISPRRTSLRPLCSVYRAALLSIFHALRIEHTAQDVVAHAGQVLHAAAADQHHRMLLQIMPLARDVAH